MHAALQNRVAVRAVSFSNNDSCVDSVEIESVAVDLSGYPVLGRAGYSGPFKSRFRKVDFTPHGRNPQTTVAGKAAYHHVELSDWLLVLPKALSP